MPLSPYLSFAGNCADAIAYYQRTLGAELLYKISFGEMPKSAQDSAENCPSGMQFPDTAIAHANVRIAGSDIMMSDAIPSGKASYSGFTLVLDSQQSKKGNAGLTILPPTEKSKWPGRKLSGRMASAKSPINLAYRG